ncbi:hypothetical protein OGR47_02825 [Methylocystis sp. MJC1]|nr:hypothetical protein [Methylocystis sp. MJC1]KAF2991130.1 hypothetical protein MJC1_01863 [Methylocystis sp. MJC1]UZX12414.1 hypothetical protein OGR47_02825 [Methylocystis sp. MJC1]
MHILTDNQFVTFLVTTPCLILAAGFAAGQWLFRDLLTHAE